MRQHVAGGASFGRKLITAAVAGFIAIGLVVASRARAQSSAMDWEKAAGGEMTFEVASVRQSTAHNNAQHSNIDLSNRAEFVPTGGLFSTTNLRLTQYISFAYKLTTEQYMAVSPQLPKWANTQRYDIEARATGNPAKDQYRLMMQDLLRYRFKLVVHFESKQIPVLALVLDRSRKLGPNLRQHLDNPPCPTSIPSAVGPVATVAGGFPEPCGKIVGMPGSKAGRVRGGGRDVQMATIASSFSSLPSLGIDRPVLDRTGLSGTFDYVIEIAPQSNGPVPPDANLPPDQSGPTFLEALREQLGLKLVPEIASMDTIVIDHVEEPSEN